MGGEPDPFPPAGHRANRGAGDRGPTAVLPVRFYDYGRREIELLDYSPVVNVRRPRVAQDSPTIGLAAAELDRLLTAADGA